MKKLIGFISFWIAVGMLIGMLVENKFISLLIISALLLIGYNLYCNNC